MIKIPKNKYSKMLPEINKKNIKRIYVCLKNVVKNKNVIWIFLTMVRHRMTLFKTLVVEDATKTIKSNTKLYVHNSWQRKAYEYQQKKQVYIHQQDLQVYRHHQDLQFY